MKRVESIEHPPKVDLEQALREKHYDESARSILRLWHESLKRTYMGGYLPEDMDDDWSLASGVSFYDTLPVYTVEVDGKPQTFGDVLIARDRVQEVTEKMREEGKL